MEALVYEDVSRTFFLERVRGCVLPTAMKMGKQAERGSGCWRQPRPGEGLPHSLRQRAPLP